MTFVAHIEQEAIVAAIMSAVQRGMAKMPEFCRVTSDDFRNHLTDYLNRAHHAGERALITRSGLGIAAVVSVEDFELLRALEDRIDGANADEAIRFASESDFIPWDQVR